MGTFGLLLVMVGILGIAVYLITAMLFHIRSEKRREGLKKTWANFSLSIAFCLLFLASWALHGIAEWNTYVEDQRAHEEPVELVGYLEEFSAATLENWQSEFLQLFSFVVLAALYMHHGSAESKDGEERIEAALRRIEEKLGAKG